MKPLYLHCRCPIVAAVLMICAFGCKKSIEVQNITSMVAVVADAASSDDALPKIFAEDALPPPEERDRLASFSYAPVGAARIKGETATIKVRVRKDDKEVGQMEWAFVRQGEQWKLKSAPLP